MADDRMPPHDLDAEEAVLGSFLIDGESFDRVSSLRATDFFRDKNQWVFSACKALHDSNKAINQVTVAHELGKANRLDAVGGSAYLGNLIMNVPTSLHVEYYSEIVRELARARALIDIGDKIVDLGYSGGKVEESVSKATKLLHKFKGESTDLREINWFDADESSYINMELPFNLHRYVKLFGGPVVVIAGESGKGKSTFLMDCIIRNLTPDRKQYLFVNDAQDVEIKEKILGICEHRNRQLPQPEELQIFERFNNFGDVIVRDGINYVDYLDVNSEFYEIGQQIDDIYRATGNGLTFIALQKNPKEKLGVGGIYSLKRSQLYITLSEAEPPMNDLWSCQLLLKKTRGRADKKVDPTGKKIHYDIYEGCKFSIEQV